MCDSVPDPGFVTAPGHRPAARAALAGALHPALPEIGYAEALRRGCVHEAIPHQLDTGHEPDLALAERLICERLPPITVS